MDVRLPDGQIISNVPDGTTKAELVEKLKRNGYAVPSEWLADQPASPTVQAPTLAPRTLADQIGLTLRAGVKGAAALPALGADAIGEVANIGLGAAGSSYRFKPLSQSLDGVMNTVGLPSPRTPMERIVSTGTEMMAGAGGGAKLMQAGADLIGKVPAAFRGLGLAAEPSARSAIAQQSLSRMADDSLMQVVAAGASGLAGGQAKEAGAGGLGQFVSAAGGGLAGAGAVAGVRGLVGAVKGMLPKQQVIEVQRVDQIINVSLQKGGIDPESITPAMRNMLRENVAKAMDKGQLSEDAIARLADYSRLGLTPTRRRLTLDPYDVTQELNAEKMAAATGSRDALLPAISQGNNKTLMQRVDDFGPTRDKYALGNRAMAPIMAEDASREATKRTLYGAADAMAGGDIPLQRAPFMDAIYSKLNGGNLIRHVPANVQSMMDDISAGVIKRGDQSFDVPFNVNTIDSLKSLIATEQRSSTGSAKMALSVIRNSLDEVPVTPSKKTFGGNQLVTEAGAGFLKNQDAQATRVKSALDEARAFEWQRRQWQESAPAIESALGGANAEDFIRRHVIGSSAGFDDLSRVAPMLNSSADARNAIRSGIVQHLKDAAIGKGNDAATGNFSGRQWGAAMSDIGDRKLRLFFDKTELEELKALGRVGAIETFQPRGSAVNNSNTAAGVGALLQGLSKYVAPLANKLPMGEAMITNPLNNISVSLLQRGATNIPAGLLSPFQKPKKSALDALVLPAALGGGLLATPP